ncbi:MAG: type II secretion system protein GspG [Candidatus Pacebacteria bacterium]|nr:type II secretion system protein GspG [Candidatus Paceibacterota bacterium]
MIAVIGILSTIILSALSDARDKAERANAVTELKSLRDAIFTLELDTGVMVGGLALDTCAANDEYSFEPTSPECGGGLICNTARLYPSGATYTYPSSWNGPYVSEAALLDPWGNYYLFDYDIHCGDSGNAIPSEKCNGNTGEVVGVTSAGPDGDFFTYNDNEVSVVCPQ